MNRSNKIWVKNMCQKLEGICTDIDKFVCKEPVSFVGNQMETVGANVKNFFSGFGLTQVMDPVLTSQLIPSKCINLVESSTNSVVEIKENSVDSNKNNPKEAVVDPVHVVQLVPSKRIDFVGSSTNSVVEFNENTVDSNTNNPKETVMDPVHVAQLIPSKRIDSVESSANTVVDVKENTVDRNTTNPKEAPLDPKELCHKSSSTDLHHSGKFTSEISQPLTVERESLINGTSDNTTQVNLNTSIDLQNLDNRSEERVRYDESLHSDATAFECTDLGIDNNIDWNLDINNMTEGDPLMNLEEEKTLLNSPIDEAEYDSNTSATHQSSELERSVTCNENQEKHIIAGGLSSDNTESLNSSFRNFTVEPDTIDCNPTEAVDYFSVSSDDLSSYGSFTTIACDSGNEADVSCSGTGLADGSMVDFEDIEYDSVENSVIVERGRLSLFPTTSRSKSYKKMIQDALMSRKKITKEYKQLAILYGDIEKELCQPTKSSKPAAKDLPDSEWELL